jgi:hypothetical protein
MQGAGVQLQEILDLAPEWKALGAMVLERGIAPGATGAEFGKNAACNFALLCEVGPAGIYQRLRGEEKRDALLRLVRDSYLLVLTHKIFRVNGTIRRFFAERSLPADEQKSQVMSMSVDVAWKLEASLKRNLEAGEAKGFKVLLPAYVQTSVNNAVLDYIKNESHWERQTAASGNDEDGFDEDAITRTADDLALMPEQLALSAEKVRYLNELRSYLRQLFAQGKPGPNLEALTVIDCMFGLGLTAHSRLGQERTMRECCELLSIEGETQARKIARCQVLADRGLDCVRQLLRQEMPGVVQCWQAEINVNLASKRDLNHRLDLTEGEVDRLIVSRQYQVLEQLVERSVIKADKLPFIKSKGAVAAFIPIDLNSCTPREMTDILGLSKELAKKVVESRPLIGLESLVELRLYDNKGLAGLKQRGAVVKSSGRLNLNTARLVDLIGAGLTERKAESVFRGRPYASWNEVEDLLGYDEGSWQNLRKNFCLGENPA